MPKPSKQKRVLEIELMKAAAIIGMVLVHVLEGSLDVLENAWTLPGSIPYTLIEFLGGIPAAGVFTFAMGWGVAYSDGRVPLDYVKRALKIGLLLFYINFAYTLFPEILDPADFGAASDNLYAIIGFNIYSLAAVMMLYFALMKKLADQPKARLGISAGIVIAVFAAGILVPPESYSSGNPWIDTFLGAFVRENHYSWFPLVPWAVFPIMGYGAGLLYRRWSDRKKFALASLEAGTVLILVSEFFIHRNKIPDAAMNPGWVQEIDYYSLVPWNIVCACGIICVELAIAFGILTITKGKIHWIFLDMSRNVMRMFLVHWAFVSPLFLVLLHVTNVWINALIGLAVLIVTFLIVEAWGRWERKDI